MADNPKIISSKIIESTLGFVYPRIFHIGDVSVLLSIWILFLGVCFSVAVIYWEENYGDMRADLRSLMIIGSLGLPQYKIIRIKSQPKNRTTRWESLEIKAALRALSALVFNPDTSNSKSI